MEAEPLSCVANGQGGTAHRSGRTLYNKRFRVMGGWGLVRFVADCSIAEAETIARRAIDEAERIERKYSRFLPGSVVSRINRDAGRTPVAVDQETVGLTAKSLDLAERTEGAFSPAVGALRRVWNFRAGRVPASEEVAALVPLLDWRLVSLRHGTVFLRRDGMEMDFGGVGKEYAADRVAARLEDLGVESAVVNLAGDLRTVGSRGDGRPWKIGVQDPRHLDRCRFAIRTMGEAGVASSGDYERFFMADGVRYHHLFDARTGWPARGVASVTTIAPTAFEAGLASTAAFLLGETRGIQFLEQAPRIEGVLITEHGKLLVTSGMERYADLPGSIFASYPML